MIRDNTDCTRNAFYTLNDQIMDDEDEYKNIFFVISSSKHFVKEKSFDRYSLDLTTTSCFAMLADWSKKHKMIEVYHDNSKAIEYTKHKLKEMASYKDVDKSIFGFEVPVVNLDDIFFGRF